MPSYRDFLVQEIEKRMEMNPRYTFAEFSHQLKISSSHLSRVLRGERNISVSKAMEIAEALQFDPQRTQQFLKLVRYATASNDKEKLAKLEELVDGLPMPMDDFKLISDWIHMALLALLKNQNPPSDDYQRMAESLNVSVTEVKLALRRLEKLDLVAFQQGQWVLTEGPPLRTSNDISSMAIRKNHRQQITKALGALEEQDVKEREFGNVTLSFPLEELDNAKNDLRDFIRSFNSKYHGSKGNSVYQLNIQFFRVDRSKNSGVIHENSDEINESENICTKE